ncbi:MAG: transcription antitermination factor NusB [Lachnospiraceae bacterium]|nr:transcription antitermination factor NusB [Lachnospiraceae bacterium]
MTFREIRDHKFKVLFMYYCMKTDIDQLLLNYFSNFPYEEEEDENDYTKNTSKYHQNVAKVNLKEVESEDGSVSDAAVAITLTEDDNIRDIKNKVKEVIEKTDEIDKLIAENLESWDIKRVAKAEITIIRLAIYEMYYDASIDIPVAINEAVELAKVYGDDKADKFVNGVLSTIYRKKSEK